MLQDIRVAVLISDGVEETELNEVLGALKAAGASVDVLAQTREQMQRGIQGMQGMRLTKLVSPQMLIQDASPDRYQGVLVPGGALSVDRMRDSQLHMGFLQNLIAAEKPVALIGHAAWLLADSGDARAKTLTSAPSIRKDLERAGAIWKDEEVIEDASLITARGSEHASQLAQLFVEKLGALYKSEKKRAA